MNYLNYIKIPFGFPGLKHIMMMLIGLVLFSSCEKVIELDLKNAEPVLVIDGSISNLSENHFVRISKTIPFTESNKFNGIKGAKVTLSSSSGQFQTFTEISEGVYRSPRFRGTPGVSYKLDVEAEGKLYTASSIMPFPVTPDSIGFKILSFLGDSKIYPTVYYNDPPKVQNQYRYLLNINKKPMADIVIEDRFNDGNTVSDIIIFDGDEIKSGDTIGIEMQTIDRNVFKYYFSISQISGNGGPPVAPANPNSNFSNGALGIFNACTKSSRSVTLK